MATRMTRDSSPYFSKVASIVTVCGKLISELTFENFYLLPSLRSQSLRPCNNAKRKMVVTRSTQKLLPYFDAHSSPRTLVLSKKEEETLLNWQRAGGIHANTPPAAMLRSYSETDVFKCSLPHTHTHKYWHSHPHTRTDWHPQLSPLRLSAMRNNSATPPQHFCNNSASPPQQTRKNSATPPHQVRRQSPLQGSPKTSPCNAHKCSPLQNLAAQVELRRL